MIMVRKGLFFISDYRDVTCKPGRDPAYWILKSLDKNENFDVYSTANNIINNKCFDNISFSSIAYKGTVNIQVPTYNWGLYKSFKKVQDKIDIIHHCEKFQVGKGYNFIPLISDMRDKNFIIGPIEVPHELFKDDFLGNSQSSERLIKSLVYHSRSSMALPFKILFDKTVEHADKFVVPNESTKFELARYVSKKSIEVINFGVDLSLYKKYEYRNDDNNHNIIYAGEASERKGVMYLIKALPLIKRNYPDVTLHLRSDGLKLDEFKQKVVELGIQDSVVFHDKLDKENYLDLISNCRVVCLPTLSDSYCYIALDALCLGVPVVATTECKCDDLFENGEIGIRVEPKDSEQLADAILNLFGDSELCQLFSENGLKKRDKFDFKNIVPKYLDIYEQYI